MRVKLFPSIIFLLVSLLIFNSLPVKAETPPILYIWVENVNGLYVTVNGVTFPGEAGESIIRLSWDWGDHYVEDLWFPASHMYSKEKTYILTVTAYQSDGLTTSKSIKISLNPKTYTVHWDGYYASAGLGGYDIFVYDETYNTKGDGGPSRNIGFEMIKWMWDGSQWVMGWHYQAPLTDKEFFWSIDHAKLETIVEGKPLTAEWTNEQSTDVDHNEWIDEWQVGYYGYWRTNVPNRLGGTVYVSFEGWPEQGLGNLWKHSGSAVYKPAS